jgi:hypothetical protein
MELSPVQIRVRPFTLIDHFLKAAEETELQTLSKQVLNQTVTGTGENLLVFYQNTSGRIEVYESEKSLDNLLNPFRDLPDYVLGVNPSYNQSKSYFGVEENELETITGRLYSGIQDEKDAYMKIVGDLET